MWNRIACSNEGDPLCDSKIPNKESNYHLPQVPIVKHTFPAGESQERRIACSDQPPHLITGNAKSDTPKEQVVGPSVPLSDQTVASPLQKREPRKFHLTKSAHGTASRNGIHKRKKNKRTELAVFVEKAEISQTSRSRLDDLIDFACQADHSPEDALKEPRTEQSTPRKRPLATPAELKWRAETRKRVQDNIEAHELKARQANGNGNSIGVTHDVPMELALKLQQFALAESRKTSISFVPRPSNTRIKPKPPIPRVETNQVATMLGHNSEGDETESLNSVDDDDAFVYDVYVRQTAVEESSTSPQSLERSLETADPNKVGMLVIAEEHQDTWEMYGEEEQFSDEEWESEEDENG